MKKAKRKPFTLWFLLLANFAFAQLSGSSFSEAKASKIANLTYVYADIEGFTTKDENGKISGLYVDLMNNFESFVLSKYGITIKRNYRLIEVDDFQYFLKQVRNSSNGVFGFHTTTIKEERKEFLKFTPPILNNISVLITNKSVPTLSSLDNVSTEFKSFVAYTVPGSTYHQRIVDLKSEKFKNLQIAFESSNYGFIDRILREENAFGFIDINYYLEYLKKGANIKRHPVGDKEGEQYGITMPLNSDWDTIMEEFLNGGFLKSPKFRQIVIDNLGKGALRMVN